MSNNWLALLLVGGVAAGGIALKTKIQSLENQIRKLDLRINELLNENKTLRNTVTEKESIISQKDNKIQKLEGIISQQNSEIIKKDQEIKKLREQKDSKL
ncbi:hypothetical protein [Candidatus Nitrosotenuis chungbukensis]|uniref:hypothetical protein n=1 Tax=Candidatus Nitrosotenuis chungbukensis TaxID=1353246 RepID=UPI0005B285F2|nr:hypothetical protein [Candidatus Nitrosotenuis chungbukensis]